MNQTNFSNNLQLVSIGVASYNNSRFILQTLNSIEAQTYKKLEIIINDDCSTDNSVAVIERWMETNKHLRIIFLKKESNKGLCKSLNNILEVYTGDYLSIIASDDNYLPDFVYNRVNYLKLSEDDVGICYSTSLLIDEKESKQIGIEERDQWLSGSIFEKICGLNGSFCKPFTSMVKRSVYDQVGKYDETLLFEDIDFFLRAAQKFKINYLTFVDTEYRIVAGSLGTQVYSAKGLQSLSKIVHKNFGVSCKSDLILAKRLRKIALKKLNADDNTWVDDLSFSNKYNNFFLDKVLVILKKIGVGNKILKKFRK